LQKALFLDRDGIINVDHGYVYKKEDFEFTEGIFDLLRLFIDKGYLLFIVTNQSGIGRTYYSEEDFRLLTSWMLVKFKKENISIVSVHHCNHAPEKNCACRKPATGMVDEILSKNSIDLANSWLIGDKQSDIDLAKNSKIKNTIAIGKRKIGNATLAFLSILECSDYMEVNKDRII
jgi:D-glycero-D-manno-heptose 1,7-bisphosphate phosphatase